MQRVKKRLQPVALYPADRRYVRSEAASRDLLPADIVSEAITAYRKQNSEVPTGAPDGAEVGKGAAS